MWILIAILINTLALVNTDPSGQRKPNLRGRMREGARKASLDVVLLIGAIVPVCDRRNRVTFGSSKMGQFVIGEMEPDGDRRNETTS